MEAYTETLPNSLVKIQMIPVAGGSIEIGGKKVEVKPFFMAQTETPWEAFDVFTKSGRASPAYDQTEFPPDAIARPSKSYILPDLGWGHVGYPAINLSFTSTDMFCRWLASVAKKKYRLPTEAEWEMACRAGAAGPTALTKESADKQAWFVDNANRMTHPVAKKEPNALGLHDMFGNVGEWAIDVDGKPVLCGSTFQDDLAGLTSAARRRWAPKWQETDPQIPKSRWWLSDAPFAGFRVVCVP